MNALLEPQTHTNSPDKEKTTPWSYSKISLFHVVKERNGHVVTSRGGLFNRTLYSSFKYGDAEVARHYGRALAHHLLAGDAASKFDDQHPVVVTASAYKCLPTAAQLVADFLVDSLREQQCAVNAGRIHRSQLTEGDYGTMSVEERQYWMANNGLSVKPEDFEGHHVMVVDDIKISGSHERSIWNMFADMPILSLTSIHVVELAPALASQDPQIEDRLNHATIRTLEDLQELIEHNRKSYRPTARMVKFLLCKPADEVQDFLAQCDTPLVQAIHHGMIGDGYDEMETYRQNTQLVIDELARR